MRPWPLLFVTLLLTSSCGGFQLFTDLTKKSEREIASLSVQELLQEERETFAARVDEKLLSIHSYYVIAYRNMIQFDESINELKLSELYQSSPYLSLLAVQTQVHELESELSELNHEAKNKVLKERVKAFADRSFVARMSMMNLSESVGMNPSAPERNVSAKDIEAELKELETLKEFMIFDKNIDHLSHLMEMDIKSKARKFRPSESEMGNVIGSEFPAKVWALTFENGPTNKTSPLIIQNLKNKNMKATFFQVADKARKDSHVSKTIRDAGMEIGSHSQSHKELTKVGGITLDKEITLATQALEKDLKIDVKFFRLPFGSGVSVPHIRQAIAKNKLIHAFWNVDTLDWMAQTPAKIVERTKRLMQKTPRDAGVILFHDTHMRGVIASSEIMDHLKQNGRRSCTLGKIVKDMNEDSKTVCSTN